MTMYERIETRLRAAFSPQTLEVIDDSASHAGHGGARPGGETHFHVVLVSDAFAGLSRVKRHQSVYAALAEEMAGGVHALSLETRAPGEA
jgi:BolA protein